MKNESDKSDTFLLPWIVFLSVVLALSLALPPGFETLFPEKGIPLFTCLFRQATGVACPLCGMTRSFVHAAHFNPMESFHSNPVGLFLFSYLLIYLGTGITYLIFRFRKLLPLLSYKPLGLIVSAAIGSWAIRIVCF